MKNMRKYCCRGCIVLLMLVSVFMMFPASTVNAASLKKVAEVKLSKQKNGSVKLTWKKVKNATGYQVYVRKGSGAYKLQKSPKTNKATLSGLKSGNKYAIKIRAYRISKGKKTFGNYSKIVSYKLPDEDKDTSQKDVNRKEDENKTSDKLSDDTSEEDTDEHDWSSEIWSVEDVSDSKDELARKKAREIIAQIIDPDMTEFMKIFKVYEYMANNISYPERGIKYREEHYTAYGALVNKIAVCDGFAKGFNVFMSELGIESERVVSLEENHAWNIVKLEGQWYELDVAWQSSRTIETVGDVNDFFLRKKNYIHNVTDAKAPHYEYCNSNYDYNEKLVNYFYDKGTVVLLHSFDDLTEYVNQFKTPGKYKFAILVERGTALNIGPNAEWKFDFYNEPNDFMMGDPWRDPVVTWRPDYLSFLDPEAYLIDGKYFIGKCTLYMYAYERNDGDIEKADPQLVNYCSTKEKVYARLEEAAKNKTDCIVTGLCDRIFLEVDEWFKKNGRDSYYMTLTNQMSYLYNGSDTYFTLKIPLKCFYDCGVIKTDIENVYGATYGLGERFDSKNNWSIVFDSVQTHPLCNPVYNQNNHITDGQNIMIKCTFTNNSDQNWQISEYILNVYDSDDNECSWYSCFDSTTNWKSVQPGESVEINCVVYTKKETQKIRVVLSGFLHAQDESVTFVLPVS